MAKSRDSRSPLWRLAPGQEVGEELEFHIEMRTREYIEQGMSEDEARAKALERFGDQDQHRGDCERLARARNRRWSLSEGWDELRADASFAIRQLVRNPGYAIAVLVILTLGIGVNLAGYSILHNAILQPLPFPEPDRLVTLWEQHDPRDNRKNVVGPANFMEWRDQSESFDSLAAYLTIEVNALLHPEAAAQPRRAKSRIVTDQFFETLGAAPHLGRTLTREDYAGGAEGSAVAVLAYDFWQSAYGGDRAALGQVLEVNGSPTEIVGVMPKGFDLDVGAVGGLGAAPDFYTQLPISERWRMPRGRWLLVLGRLSEGVGFEQAAAEMEAVSLRLQQQFPDFDAGWRAELHPLRTHMNSIVEQATWTLFAAVGVLLLVVAVNVGSLLVARAGLRSGEISVRLALGAGPGRLVRQIVTEGAMLSALGAVGGLGVAWTLLRISHPWLPPDLVERGQLGSAGPVALYLLVLAGLCTLFFGLAPVWHILRARGQRSRRHQPRPLSGTRTSIGASRRGQRLRGLMVFSETALAVVLLVVAGLLLRSIITMTSVDPGFDREQVLTVTLDVPSADYDRNQFYDELLARAKALPGVLQAGAASSIPMAGPAAATSFWPLDRPEPAPDERQVADIRILRGDYLATLEVPLVAGRLFDQRDHAEAPKVVLISQQVADRYWPNADPVGQELHLNWGNDCFADAACEPHRIVGVVGNVQYAGFDTPPRPAVYLPHPQDQRGEMTVALRTSGPPDQVARPLRALISEMAPTLPLSDVLSLETAVDGTVAQERFVLRGVSAFALLSLVLAAVGLYSVTSYAASQRRAEMALRMALGAAPRDIQGLVLRDAGRLVVAGLLVGLVLALLAARALQSQLFGIEATDPVTFGGVALVLAAAALAAILVPALRASRSAPAEALRQN